MEKLSRERQELCAQEYEDFRACLEFEFDPELERNQGKGYYRKMYNITRGKACHKYKNAMSECSKRCLFNEELYYEAKALFNADRDKYMEAMVPIDVREYLLKGIKGGEAFYFSGNKSNQNDFDERTIEFIRRESLKHGTYPVYFNKEGNWIDYRKELLKHDNPRQAAKEKAEILRREIAEIEKMIEKEKENLPELPFKTIDVLDSKGNSVDSLTKSR